jgi:uncharacterized protein (DUF2141 family)
MKILTLALLLFFSGEKNHSLSINISGIKEIKGSLYIAIFRPIDSFPVFGRQFKGLVKQVKGTSQIITFNELPPGIYSIAVYHDINKNNVLDKNLLGIPTEIYGFSNNARRTFSAPSFQEAMVILNKDMKISIQLK